MFLSVVRSILFLLVGLWSSWASAQVSFSNEDRATVRVMAVQGVVSRVVKPPAEGRKAGPITIGVVEAGHGSGVMVTHDGIIVTAQHVIDDAEFVSVLVPGRAEALMALVVYENKKHDVAFLKVTGRFDAIVPLGDRAAALLVRSRVYALGYPIDGTREYPQSNAGVVAGELPNGELQLGLSVNPGNSGGPLIDEQGALVGIVVRTASVKKGWQGISIAVPLREVQKFYRRRVVGSRNLSLAKGATKELKNSASAAEFVARIASVSSIGTAIDHIEDTSDDLQRALVLAARSHKDSPDFLALLSAHYWNESVIRFSLGGREWKQALHKSGTLARRAVRLDPRVLNRSPFLYSALGGKSKIKKGAKATPRAAPRRIAGFRLGWSLEETRDACTIEELTFQRTQNGYRCSEPPVSGSLGGPVDLTFCGTRLCRVDVLDRPSRALSSLWVDQFKSTYRAMKLRYGQHSEKSVKVPSKCREDLLSCLEQGKASIMYRWTWKGRSLRLTLARYKGVPTMRVILRDTPRQATRSGLKPRP